MKEKNKINFSVDDWSDLLKPWNKCPHPQAGKVVRVASNGPNPFMFTDYDRKIVNGEDGLPLGTNIGIAKTLAKVFNFSLAVRPFNAYDYYDEKAKKWMGMTGEVGRTSILF